MNTCICWTKDSRVYEGVRTLSTTPRSQAPKTWRARCKRGLEEANTLHAPFVGAVSVVVWLCLRVNHWDFLFWISRRRNNATWIWRSSRLEMLSAVATGFSTQVEEPWMCRRGLCALCPGVLLSTRYPLLYLLPTYLLSFQLDSDEQSYRERGGFWE